MAGNSVTYVTNPVMVHSEDFLELFKAPVMEIETFGEPTLGFEYVTHSIEDFTGSGGMSTESYRQPKTLT